MQTYVINTSENRVFNSNLLFELVGYNKITWMYSGLDKVHECAKTIIERQSAPMADECRVVVLVDFYSFPHTLHPDREAACDYIAIYKSFIEIYLLDRLFDPMRAARIDIDGKEIFYIQYMEQATHRVNAAEKEHVAFLFQMEDEYRRLRKKGRAALKKSEDSYRTSVTAEEYHDRMQEEKKAAESAKKADKKKEEEASYSTFTMKYDGGALAFSAESFYRNDDDDGLDEDVDGRITFENFYRGFTNRKAQPQKYGIQTRAYIATGTAPSRAAFDTLALSLSLIRIYEREDRLPGGEGEDAIPRIDKRAFSKMMQTSYSKVNSALEKSRNTGNEYYMLKWPVDEDERTEDEEKPELSPAALEEQALKERRAALEGVKMPAFEDKYRRIRRLASRVAGKKSPEEQKELDKLMAHYKAKRDEKRESITKEEDKRQILRQAKTGQRCPSDLDYKNVMARREKKLQGLLKSALAAEYVSTDYTEELEKANKVYDKYKAAEACMTKNVIGDALFLIATLLIMLIPYAALQCADNPFSPAAIVLYGISAALFGGIFLFSFFLHVLPFLKRMESAKARMQKIYEECLVKQYRAFAKLRRRYEKELLEIEDIRYEMRVISYLHSMNYEQNRHVDEHREMLERVKDALFGMMSNLQITPEIIKDVSIEGEFNIEKPFTSAENRVYKVFSLEAIDEMFKEGGKA